MPRAGVPIERLAEGEAPVVVDGWTLYGKVVTNGAREKPLWIWLKGKPADAELFLARIPQGYAAAPAKRGRAPEWRIARDPAPEAAPERETREGDSYAKDVAELEAEATPPPAMDDDEVDEGAEEAPFGLSSPEPDDDLIGDVRPRITPASPERRAAAEEQTARDKLAAIARSRARVEDLEAQIKQLRAALKTARKELAQAMYAAGAA